MIVKNYTSTYTCVCCVRFTNKDMKYWTQKKVESGGGSRKKISTSKCFLTFWYESRTFGIISISSFPFILFVSFCHRLDQIFPKYLFHTSKQPSMTTFIVIYSTIAKIDRLRYRKKSLIITEDPFQLLSNERQKKKTFIYFGFMKSLRKAENVAFYSR